MKQPGVGERRDQKPQLKCRNQPKYRFERLFFGFMAKIAAGKKGSRAAPGQGQQMQAFFRDAPVVLARRCLVIAISGECQDVDEDKISNQVKNANCHVVFFFGRGVELLLR